MKRKITIGDKTYTLTATRNIIKTLYEVSPEILSMATIKNDAERKAINAKVSVDIVAGLDKIFYELIKVAQPTITFEKSIEILNKFDEEYEDVQSAIMELALSVFQQGDQKKKKIIWE